GEKGGLVTVGDYLEACKSICNQKTLSDPFLCLDCSYITALLHHGLGFNKNKEIMLVKEIDGVEASWGLGAAFSMLL
ncbi:Ectonucleoside triphosphate diphosphohydrolase 5, partial [Stegodyphus mimosarum]